MRAPEKITIVVANDRSLVREGLTSVLNRQKNTEVVAETGKLSEVRKYFLRHRPNVLIIDLKLEGQETLETIQKLHEQFPSLAILVVSASEGSENIYRALRAGARGYVSNDISDAELVQAIEVLSTGRSYMSSKIASKLAERMNKSTLSRRELEVLQFIVKGKTNKEIANDLNVTEDAIKFHVKTILSKLGVTDRTQAATAALIRGIIHPQDL